MSARCPTDRFSDGSAEVRLLSHATPSTGGHRRAGGLDYGLCCCHCLRERWYLVAEIARPRSRGPIQSP